jgi:hypothetical protein
MMATTHVLAGLLVAALASIVAPDATLHVALAGALGGLLPDLDLYAGHRKTLHFPVYGSIAAGLGVLVAALSPTTLSIAGAVFLTAFALHSVSDVLGGGLELRPWEGTSNQAVFSHFHGTWWAPRRLVRYDGAPEDLAVAAVLAVPGLLVFDGQIDGLIAGALAISAGYVLVRKPLVQIAEWLVQRIPSPVLQRVPARFVEDVV